MVFFEKGLLLATDLRVSPFYPSGQVTTALSQLFTKQSFSGTFLSLLFVNAPGFFKSPPPFATVVPPSGPGRSFRNPFEEHFRTGGLLLWTPPYCLSN